MLKPHSTLRCCTHVHQPLQQTVTPCVSRVRAHGLHALFSGHLVLQSRSTLLHTQHTWQRRNRCLAQQSISCSSRTPTAAPDGSDDNLPQCSHSCRSDAQQHTGRWHWRSGVLAAGLVGCCAAAASLAAGPALADAARSQLLTGPVVPGLLGDSPIREGVVEGFLLIFLSELGDKTFFIAALLALQYKESRGIVFGASFGALAVMTVISVGLGLVLHQADELIDTRGVPIDDLVAVALLLYFGIRTLQEASNADEKAKEEEEDAQEATAGITNGAGIFFQIFTLVFAAEWGDKSFLATIALAASSSPAGVVAGAVGGHAVATTIAILGGSVLSKYVSERTVQYLGGSLFLVFAASTIVDIVRGV